MLGWETGNGNESMGLKEFLGLSTKMECIDVGEAKVYYNSGFYVANCDKECMNAKSYFTDHVVDNSAFYV